MRTLLTLLFISLLCTCGRAQKTSSADSLRQLLTTTLDDSVRVHIYVELIGDQLQNADTTAAKLYLDTLLTLAVSMSDPFSLGKYHYMKGQRHNKLQQWEAGLAEAKTALGYFEEAGSAPGSFDGQWLAGLMNMRLGKTEAAFRRYLSALEMARATDNKRAVFQTLNELGNAHRRSGNLDEAATYYGEAITVARQMEGVREEVSSVNNLAIVRKNQQRFEEARDLYQSGLELTQKLTEPRKSIEQGYIYVNLAQLANANREPDQALAYARLAYDRFEKHGSPREQAAALLQMGTASGRLGRYEASERYYREARRVGADYIGLVRASTHGLISVFKNVGPLDSAVYYLEQAAENTKQAAEANRIEAIAEMEARYQNQEKQAEIDRLAMEDELSKARIGRQRVLLLTGLLLLGLLGGFLYFLLRQRRRIQGQNETITKSLEEKETLLKEIHHRVKNNLQMVSSLLSLQSDYIEDDAALDALEMGRQRVRSMAIIHQRLYLRDEVTTEISAREYLDQLIGELMVTLNVKGLALNLVKQLEDISLDIDRMIPLGLVANEVITNVMKHAFPGRESGRLEVHFRRSGDKVELMISDDGHGMAKGFTGREDSFGNLLIRTFTEQLEGELFVDTGDGTRIRLRFPEVG